MADRAWIRLPSGAAPELINPSPDAWTDEDLALRLARTYRWGGESTWTWPLSVAQHSLLVLALRRESSDTPLTLAGQRELLHDAEEGFRGLCTSVHRPNYAGFGTMSRHRDAKRDSLDSSGHSADC
jgi:hypothetical protein